MNLSRREFLELLAAGAAGLGLGACDAGQRGIGNASASSLYEAPPYGNLTLLHFTDCHAQLRPLYYREPSINLGAGAARNKPPHLVGEALRRKYRLAPGSIEAHAFTHLNFAEAAQQYGQVGGFAHLATLIKNLRISRPGRTLLLDGGDTWQGSATSLWTAGADMIGACKLLGVDAMTAHWEFTYGSARVKEAVQELSGRTDFLAHNVFDSSFGEDRVFAPYVIREVNKIPVAIIGQAYPYTPIANNRYAFEQWTFGIREEELQKLVDQVRTKGAQVVVLLSHNGADVDLKLASRVSGIDVVLGGHTHDAMPEPVTVSNAGGKTLVIQSGSHTKFLSLLDLKVRRGRVRDFRYRLMPIFSNLIAADREMAAYIDKVRAPYKARLEEKLAVTESLLYRRGNFNGSFDELILQALLATQDAQIAFSPGFRWGATLLPGETITMEKLMDHTAITYPGVSVNEFTGTQIKDILEDIADNLFHPDPYYQQGGDMVRTTGLRYTLDLTQARGNRIQDLELGGQPIAPEKAYKVAGWASVQPQPAGAKPIWEVVAQYLRQKKTIRMPEPYTPRLKGADGDSGMAGTL
jgi:sulfur-oxidizing protein SoxB